MEQIEPSKVLDFIAKIYEEKHQAVIDRLEAKPKIQETVYKSECLVDFAIDLPKAQAEYDVAFLNKSNPFFKSRYADLLSSSTGHEAGFNQIWILGIAGSGYSSEWRDHAPYYIAS